MTHKFGQTWALSRRKLLRRGGLAAIGGGWLWNKAIVRADAAETAAVLNERLLRVLERPVLALDGLDQPVRVESLELLRNGRSFLMRSRSSSGVEAVTVPNPSRMAETWPIAKEQR